MGLGGAGRIRASISATVLRRSPLCHRCRHCTSLLALPLPLPHHCALCHCHIPALLPLPPLLRQVQVVMETLNPLIAHES